MPAEQILERLMREYGDSVFRMRYLYLKDYYLAEDATQETFIKAMKSYDSFLHNSNEKTWLIRIAINSCKNIMRTKWFRFPMMNVDDQQYIADDHSIETVVATLAILMLGGTTVAASYSFTNKISVNDEVLTELDEMHVMVSTYWILSWQITTIIFKGISQQMIKIMQ